MYGVREYGVRLLRKSASLIEAAADRSSGAAYQSIGFNTKDLKTKNAELRVDDHLVHRLLTCHLLAGIELDIPPLKSISQSG